jgi:prepilin-type N-terminal cleavage/methylation domain-containing protein
MRQTRPRAAYTLIELLITMVIGATILAAGMTLLVQAIRANAAAADHARTIVNLGRLSEQFRADVHDSRTLALAKVGDSRPGQLALTSTDGSHVEYVLTPDELTRTRTAGDRVVERDVYRLATMRAVGLRADQAGGEAAIVIQRITPLPSGEVALGKFEILAVAPRAGQRAEDKPPVEVQP